MFWIHVETCYIIGDYFMRSRTTSLSCDLRPVTENFMKIWQTCITSSKYFFFSVRGSIDGKSIISLLILNRAFQRERRLCQVLKNSL